jgi:hypothetical protein
MTLLIVAYEIHYKPFNLELTNSINLLNEFTILIVSYHLPLLANFIDDAHI